jgi:O-antigen ligase
LVAVTLLFFPLGADNFELPRQLLLAVATLWLGWRWRDVPRAALLAAAAVLAVATLSTVTSSAVWVSLMGSDASRGGLLSLAVWAAWFCVAAAAARDTPWRGQALCLCVWPVAAYALVQRLGFDPLSWSSVATWCGALRPFSILGHPFQLGVWTAMVLPLALDLTASTVGLRRAGWLATALAAAGTGLLSFSRAGWLCAAVALAVWLSLRVRRRWSLTAALAGAAAVALSAVFSAPFAARLQGFFVAPTRVDMWRAAWAAFRERPWLGWGVDTFQLVSQRFRPADAWLREWGATSQHAHSLPAQWLATLGLAGVALLCALAVALGGTFRRRRRDVPAGVWAALAAFVLSTTLGFHGTAVLALGLTLLAGLPAPDAPHVHLSRAWLSLPLLLSLVEARLVAASMLARSAMAREARGDTAGAADRYLWAERVEPENAVWSARRGLLLERRSRSPAGTDEAALSAALEAYQRAARVAPAYAVFAANEGRVLSLLGRSEAVAVLSSAVAHAPADARIRLDLAEARLRAGDVAGCRAETERVLVAYPGYGPAWWVLANAGLRSGGAAAERGALQAGLVADWRDWREGEALTRARLAGTFAAAGELERARALLAEGRRTEPEAECGDPQPVRLH